MESGLWILGFAILAIFAWAAWSVVSSFLPGKPMFCPGCGIVGTPRKSVRGSFAIEVVLWLCFIVPGLIYSLWRATGGRQTACRACGNAGVIPLESPIAKKRMAELGIESGAREPGRA